MSRVLIHFLKQAHAIEVGAYHAYYGHYKSLPDPSEERSKIKFIRTEELIHKNLIERFLSELGSGPNPIYDAILWVIGKSISAGCYVFGYKMGMWGASVMERLGVVCYRNLAKVARSAGHLDMAQALDKMQDSEEEHKNTLLEYYDKHSVRS